MNRQGLYFSALEVAARAVGEARLRQRLGVSAADLSAWLKRERRIPEAAFLGAVDVLQERAVKAPRNQRGDPEG